VQPRPPARTRAERTHLLRESGEGFQLVFGRRVLRSIALMVFVMSMFAIAPESLAAAWAAEGGGDPATRGLDQGMIMAAGPVGFVVGGLVVTRLATPALRDRLIRPLAILSSLALVPALTDPPVLVVVVLVAISGAAGGGLSPTLNGKFVLMLPHGYRARAYGVVQAGMQLAQFAGVMVTGVLADLFWLPMVVGLWSIGGTAVMAYLSARWPSDHTFAVAADEAAATMPPAEQGSPPPRHAVPAPAPAVEPTPAHAARTSVTPKHP
jgi:hypothetical protein